MARQYLLLMMRAGRTVVGLILPRGEVGRAGDVIRCRAIFQGNLYLKA